MTQPYRDTAEWKETCVPDPDHARSWETWLKARELLAYAAGILHTHGREGLAKEITAFLADTRNAGADHAAD